MKKLLILPLLVFLTGCVTYYYPETALEDGVYYAEDDPSYVVYSGGYDGVAYYPWYSMDYFYTGYYPYPGYSVSYGYASGFSVGFSYAFSPWYYPSHYYGYYSPWYGSHHHHGYTYHPAWRPYRGYYSDHRGDRGKKHRRDDRHDRYAGNDRHDQNYGSERYDQQDRNDRRNRSDDKSRHDEYAADKRRQELNERGRSSSVRRYVSTSSGARSGNRGVVIRSRESSKAGKSRLHVDPAASATTTKSRSRQSEPAKPVASTPNYSTKRTANEVRYRSNSKQTRSRITPVSPSASAGGSVARTAQVSGGNGGRSAARNDTSQKAAVRAPSPPRVSTASRSRTSAPGKQSSRAVSSSNKKSSSRRQDRR